MTCGARIVLAQEVGRSRRAVPVGAAKQPQGGVATAAQQGKGERQGEGVEGRWATVSFFRGPPQKGRMSFFGVPGKPLKEGTRKTHP